ncbi:alpha-1,2-fucosyltransferase [Pisciglobus halotolerans]|uniref:Glycosyl transferase family 11 n=1 Tax=Pisciglobus halotolerans TaxID=745365 RepID=A0A1I3DKT5_9LACT|nr:alpha-1,2-fucosyltransferase [Pisciglobus halotolerans]SFH87340.1 Glycosyl transferase family 11 [Pisciglobus halotolerans]
MKIVKFKGGLGNQLFQYAFMRLLEVGYGISEVKADFTYYNGVKGDQVRKPRIEQLNTKIKKATETDLNNVFLFSHLGDPLSFKYKFKVMLEFMLNNKYYYEKDRKKRNVQQIIEYNYFDGYWQSWKYLEQIEKELKKEISYNKDFDEKTKNFIDKIKKENAVFIGIRRGDYLESTKTRKHYGIFDSDYYTKAIEYIKEKVDTPVFYIFSNDIQWVKENMNFDANVIYRTEDKQVSDIEELFIMAACKHAIIVNSTFYWWGAWLIENENKIVIAPKKWFKDDKPIDIVPNEWIKF